MPPPATETPLTLKRRLLQYLSNGIVLVIFGASLWYGITLFLEKHWLPAYSLVTLAFMSIPFTDHRFPLRERILVSLIMASGFLGLVAFVALYLLLFYFKWFQAIFNSKAAGPLGMIFFAMMGALLGGFFGFQGISSLSAKLFPLLSPPPPLSNHRITMRKIVPQ